MVDHRHLADKGDIVKMAKVWIDARDYLFIMVSQSLQRGHTKLCSQFNKTEKYVFFFNQMFREADSLQDTKSTNRTRKGRKKNLENKAYTVVNNEKTLARNSLPK